MAGPSNIRINPFTGTGGATNYVELTEKHIIPAVSPYVIRLNEVPEKQDPSNMKIVYVNESTGAATSTTLTEVAATPGKGEFRPDYSTNALDDKTWNTGLIEFSASDAGKIVQVTYTGTGTLAGVNSNHWPSWYTDRGDGSDGDFVPTNNTTISGIKNYKSVFIKSGITITVDKALRVKCLGAFVNNGKITADGKGAAGGESITGAVTAKFGKNGGSAYGGAGGTGDHTGGAAGGAIDIFGISNSEFLKTDMPFLIGAGGGGGGGSSSTSYGSGAGGNGGGSIVITANEITNTGSITANGSNGDSPTLTKRTGRGGGGGGGSIYLIANVINSNGTITVNGGKGGTGGSDERYNGAAGATGLKIIQQLGV